MLGKNNMTNKVNAGSEKQPRFSIRKLSVGAASVMLSIFMWNAVSTTQVHAETTDQAQPKVEQFKSPTDTSNGGGKGAC
jgi:hypothetical protein